MKKILCVIAVAAMLAAMAGCSDNSQGTGETTTAGTSAAGETTTVQTSQATESSSTETVPETTTGDSENSTDSSVGKIADAIKTAYGDNYIPSMDAPEEFMTGTVGLEADSYTEYFAQTPMISAHVDTLIIVKAASGKTDEVKSKLEQYRDVLVNDTMQYPMNIAKINASKVVANGDYVAFILLGAIDEREDISEEEQAKFAEEQNKIGVDAFNAYFA